MCEVYVVGDGGIVCGGYVGGFGVCCWYGQYEFVQIGVVFVVFVFEFWMMFDEVVVGFVDECDCGQDGLGGVFVVCGVFGECLCYVGGFGVGQGVQCGMYGFGVGVVGEVGFFVQVDQQYVGSVYVGYFVQQQ